MKEPIGALLELAHGLGHPGAQLAILDEGSVAARLDEGQVAVSAAFSSLAGLEPEGVVVCQAMALLALLDRRTLPDAAVDRGLLEARVDSSCPVLPTVDALFHAWLLTLDEVRFVGHAHPVAARQILTSPRARDFAEHRMFPEEIRHCGPASVYVPYADPGLALGWQVRERTRDFIRDHRSVPRLILLQNRGLVALGPTPEAVLGTLLMANRAAAVFAGAAAMGGPTFLLPQHVDRLTGPGGSGGRAGRPGSATELGYPAPRSL
jgi:rhamnose utilization protein RhaD (predicted bifunctional aldolase and dehydrogenase)